MPCQPLRRLEPVAYSGRTLVYIERERRKVGGREGREEGGGVTVKGRWEKGSKNERRGGRRERGVSEGAK